MKMKKLRRSKAERKAARIGDPSAPRPAKYPPLTARELRKEQRRYTGKGGYKSPWERRQRARIARQRARIARSGPR